MATEIYEVKLRDKRTGLLSNGVDVQFNMQTAPTAEFPGDPGAGKILSGCNFIGSGSVSDAITWLDNAITGTKRHALARIYGYPRSGTETNRMFDWATIDTAIAQGRIPVASTKFLQFTLDQIIAGQADSVLHVEAQKFKDRAPNVIWWSFYHEPFDNFPVAGGAAAKFRAAFRYIAMLFRADGVTNVACFGPSSMVDWEYTSGGETSRGGPAFHEDPDWKGTFSGPNGTVVAADWYTGDQAVLDIFSFDIYSPPIGTTTYKTFAAQLANFKAKMDAWQRPHVPYMIAELGMHNPSTTVDWYAGLVGLRDWMLQNDVRGYCYFNYYPPGGYDTSFYSGTAGTAERLAAYSALFNNNPEILGA